MTAKSTQETTRIQRRASPRIGKGANSASVFFRKIVEAPRETLRVGLAFITYQLRSNARDITEADFAKVERDFCWLNIPPCMLTWGWKTSKA